MGSESSSAHSARSARHDQYIPRTEELAGAPDFDAVAALGDGGTYHQDIVNNYYSDNSYSYAVGWDERDCSGYLATSGSATDWRYHEVYSCGGDELSSNCQEYIPGTGWVNVACPDPTVTAQTRIHIPVGGA